jgi:hypothetical protein
MSNFCFVFYFPLHFLFVIHSSFLRCVFCSAVFPHSNIRSSQIRLLKLASPIVLYFVLLLLYSITTLCFSPLLPFFQWLYFPLFDLPFSIHKLILTVPTAGVCTLISKLQQNCWINTDQLGNVPKEQTVYRHVINKTRTVRATKYRTLALKWKS